MKPMMLVLTAVLSGAFLYLSSAAALILFGHAGLFQIGLMAVFLVAIGHASLGFRAIGGRTAWRAGDKKAAAVCALTSMLISGLALGCAIFIALRFPLMASPSAAMGIVGACAVAGNLGSMEAVRGLRDQLWAALRARLGARVVLNGHAERRLPNTLNVSFVGRSGSDILAEGVVVGEKAGHLGPERHHASAGQRCEVEHAVRAALHGECERVA